MKHGRQICAVDIENADDQPTHFPVEFARLLCCHPVDLIGAAVKKRGNPSETTQDLLEVPAVKLTVEGGLRVPLQFIPNHLLKAGYIREPAGSRCSSP